jgi:hypothetical protein
MSERRDPNPGRGGPVAGTARSFGFDLGWKQCCSLYFLFAIGWK